MTQIILTLSIIAAAMVLFVWNWLPAAVVAVGAALALYFSGVLTMQETLGGFGDPVVILIAALLAIASGLEIAGVGVWAGQLLMRHTCAYHLCHPDVFVMESTEKGDGRERSSDLHGTAKRGVLSECKMGTGAIVIVGVGSEDPVQMSLAQDQDMV